MREPLVVPARSENPGTHDELHAREPGDPAVARGWSMMPVRGGSRGVGDQRSTGREGNGLAVIP